MTCRRSQRIANGTGNGLRMALWFSILIVLTFLATAAEVRSQIEEEELQTAPPPPKIIPKQDLQSLDSEKGVTDRTKLALKLMDLRIANAENANREDDLQKVFGELGVFHALMEHTISDLGGNERMTGKVLMNFKRFEIGLRRFTPRLEMIRREMPLTHEYYVRSLLRQLREARSRATEPLFGESVLSDN